MGPAEVKIFDEVGMRRSAADAPYGIRAFCVTPGPVMTRPGMVGMKTLLDTQAEPQELVDYILYLCSENGRCVTGSNHVTSSERRSLERLEGIYRRIHRRWLSAQSRSGKKVSGPATIVDRAAEWRVRRVPVFKGFEDGRHQEHDALIVRCVDEFNRNRAVWTGAATVRRTQTISLTGSKTLGVSWP